jgi:hypothetical protein
VRLDAEVGRDGKANDVEVFEGDPMLTDPSIHAIRKWRFYPARWDGRPSRTGPESGSISGSIKNRSGLRWCRIPVPRRALCNRPHSHRPGANAERPL